MELGCGAGHNASWLKAALKLTLTDVSPRMMALSEQLNPECEHVLGDMRTMRLGRTFDAVFVHDAISHMTSREDLAAVLETARRHLRDGGALLVAPDDVKDRFQERVIVYESSEPGRSLRTIERHWDPDPSDDVACTEYTFELTDGDGKREVVDRQEFGIFWLKTWWELLQGQGFEPVIVQGPEVTPVLVGRAPGPVPPATRP